MTVLIIILAIGLVWLLLSSWMSKKEDKIELLPINSTQVSQPENPFFPPKAPREAKIEFTVLDIQTNGLITQKGDIPDAIQISWLHLSKDFQVISHKTLLIRQEYPGNLSARKVHKIDTQQIIEYGKEESEVSKILLDSISDTSVLVFHNAEFDIQVLYQMLGRHYSEEALDTLKRKKTICTMRFEEHLYDQEFRYSKLTHLAHRLSDIPLPILSDHPVTSWRNVCLTRLCLKRLCELHQISHSLLQTLLTDFDVYLSAPSGFPQEDCKA